MFRFTDLFSPESSYNKVKIYWKSPSFVLHITSLHFNSMGIVLIIKSESFSLSDYSITEHDKSIILLYFGLAIHSSRKNFYVVSYLISDDIVIRIKWSILDFPEGEAIFSLEVVPVVVVGYCT